MRLRSVWSVALFSALVWVSTAAAAFTPNRLVVSRVGDGASALSGNAFSVHLDEYTFGGVATGYSVVLPTTASGGNYALTLSGTATSVGQLSKSANGQYLAIFGVDAPVGTTSPNSNSGFRGRTVALVDINGTVNSTTRFEAAGMTPRSVTSSNGVDLWTAGDTGSGTTGGVRYNTLGSTVNGTLISDANFTTNTRVVNIYNGNLFVSASAGTAFGSWRGVNQLGSGLPTTGGQAGTVIVGGGASNAGPIDSAYDFFFADDNTLYVTDDDTTSPLTTGIQKWTFNGTSWSLAWTAPISTRSITGYKAGNDVYLFAITGESTPRLISLVDSGGPLAPSFTVLATSPTNTAFRGVEISVPEPATAAILAVIAAFGLRRRT